MAEKDKRKSYKEMSETVEKANKAAIKRQLTKIGSFVAGLIADGVSRVQAHNKAKKMAGTLNIPVTEVKKIVNEKYGVGRDQISDIPNVSSSGSKKKVVKKEKKEPTVVNKVVPKPKKKPKPPSKAISTKGQKPPIRTKVEKKTDVSGIIAGPPPATGKRKRSGLEKEMSAISASQDPRRSRMPLGRRGLASSMVEDRRRYENRPDVIEARAEGRKPPPFTVPEKPALSTSSAKPSPRVPETSEKNQRNVAEKKKEVDKKAIKRVTESNKDTDIFHQIAYGIGKITGQPATLDYTYPGDSDYNKRKGGKVSNPSRKKYAMNRGGKVASIRKPTRA